MIKRKAARPARRRPAAGKRTPARRVAKATAKRSAKKASARKKAARPGKRSGAQRAARNAREKLQASSPAAGKTPRLDRARRTLEDVVPTPPSSLDMDWHGSAARTGREEMAESHRNHKGMSPEIASGDLDVDVESAYFTGEESPGGDNPTPDQDIVDNIGKALGVQYDDAEELKSSDKISQRDKHRWELDPASSEDYKDRK
jgi:uncharacterized protein DUF6335